jgi:hypothetical protein
MVLIGLSTLSFAGSVVNDSKPSTYPYADKALNSVDTLYNDARSVIKWSVARADTLISKAVPVIGQKADYVWHVLVKQHRIIAYMWLVIFLTGIILIIAAVSNLKNLTPDSGMGIFWGIIAVLGGLKAVVASFYFKAIFTGLFNPEYGAMIQILNAIK